MTGRRFAVVNRLGRTVKLSFEGDLERTTIIVEPSDRPQADDVIADGYALFVCVAPNRMAGWREGAPLSPFLVIDNRSGVAVAVREGRHRGLPIQLLILSLDERGLN